MAIYPENVKEVFDVWYGLKTSIIIRPKNKDEAQAKNQIEKILDYRALDRTQILA